jgi:hypothetical protein
VSIPVDATQNRDGSVTLTVAVPPTPEWAQLIDAAFQRLHDFCDPINRWHFVSLSVPSYSFGYICVMEKKGITQSMSGSAGLAAAVCGFGSTEIAAIDGAIDAARTWDATRADAE